ncbi:MAG: hypothetical protein NXI13_00865 [Proteobacteria bacterium]|nr:hypothetical protein [Pseudomonadota bacterium]
MNTLARNFASVFVPVFLSGCASFTSTPSTGHTAIQLPVATIADAQGRPVKDLIAKFAMSFPPGTRGVVISADSNRYVVEVGRDYVAATQQSCRRISLESSDGQSTLSAVCQVEDIWQTILWP